jgi:nucleoside-diphosphate-sugar epimerase
MLCRLGVGLNEFAFRRNIGKKEGMSKIAVTGGSGKLGRACVKDLLAHGHDVFNVDRAAPQERICPFILADLADFGQTVDALSSCPGEKAGRGEFDAIVHLAAIPAPHLFTDAVVFGNNTLSTYNVFAAAYRLGIKNVVWASSETVLGLPFDAPPPYAPVDEEYAGRPETAYSLSKLMGEEMAKQFCRWEPTMKIIGLRFSNVMEPQDYKKFAGFQMDPAMRKWNLWGYIDARDGAQAIRRAVEAPLKGADVFIIANAETVMTQSSAQLMADKFPGVPIKGKLGTNETLLSIKKAKRVLGYKPEFGWRK